MTKNVCRPSGAYKNKRHMFVSLFVCWFFLLLLLLGVGGVFIFSIIVGFYFLFFKIVLWE